MMEIADVATYHGGQQLDYAQAVLQRHAVSSADGLCVACGVPGPCGEHETAAKAFTLSLRLPRRVPGATRPELIGARRAGERGLLAPPRRDSGMVPRP
jgi:hypothetical protein